MPPWLPEHIGLLFSWIVQLRTHWKGTRMLVATQVPGQQIMADFGSLLPVFFFPS